MQVSLEARWFYRGRAPAQLDAWFRSSDKLGGGVTRTDVYVVDPTTDELGIKERGGKPGVEIKALVDGAFAQLAIGDVSATLQLWTKVSSTVLRLDGLRTIEVPKTRWLRKFETGSDTVREIALGAGPAREDPEDGKKPDVGCNVELTEIERGGVTWFTFAIEAFAFVQTAAVERMTDAVRRTIAAIAGTGLELTGWQQASYPRWLQSL